MTESSSFRDVDFVSWKAQPFSQVGRNFISLAGLGVSLRLDQRRKQPDLFPIPLFAKNGKRKKKKRKINLFSISLNGKRCNLAIQGNPVSSSEEHQWPGYYSQIQEITVVGSERGFSLAVSSSPVLPRLLMSEGCLLTALTPVPPLRSQVCAGGASVMSCR